ncbi:restriction endonuclease subunit S [Mycobacterium kansasii]
MSGSDWFGTKPDTWQVAPLGYFFDISLGKMLNSSKKAEGEIQAPYLAAGSIQPEHIVLDETKTMPFTEVELSQYDLRKRDLVVVEGGAGYGRSHLLANDLPGWGFQNHVARLRERGTVDAGFLLYCLKACLRSGYIEANNRTSTLPSLSRDVLRSLPIPVPPPADQRAIADYLDRETARIDTLIEEQQRLIEMLRERRAAVLETCVAQLDWNCPMGAVTSLVQTGPFGSQLKSDEYVDGGVPVINPSHLVAGEIVPDQRIAVGEGKAKDLARHAFQIGDVVVARRGELGRCAVVDAASAGFLCGTGSALIRPSIGRVLPRFLALTFGSRRNRDALALASVGSTMDNLNAPILSALRIPVPPLETQAQIVEDVADQTAKIDTLIAETETFIELARERRAALITAAVTGQIDVRQVA